MKVEKKLQWAKKYTYVMKAKAPIVQEAKSMNMYTTTHNKNTVQPGNKMMGSNSHGH